MSSSTSGTSSDVVVIGSGLAGLTAAASLAAAGLSVTVLEQYTVVGGTTHAFRRKGRWEWEVGVHHLADCGPDGDMTTIYRGLGIGPDQLTFRRVDDEAGDRLAFPGLTLDVPADWVAYEQRLVDAFPEQRATIRRLLRIVRRVGAAVDRGPSSASWGGLGRTGLGAGPYAPLSLLPVQTVLDLLGLDPRLQVLLSVAPCGSLNAPPSRLPFAAFCAYYDLFINGGSWFPEGGGQMLAATLLQALEHHGGRVHTGESVEQILVDDGRVRGVVTASGYEHHAPIVVSTADLKKTFAQLLDPKAVPARTRRRVNGYRISDAFFNAFLGVDVDLAALYPARDHFSMPTWLPLDEIARRAQRVEGEPVARWLERMAPIAPGYVHVSNMKDPMNPRYAPHGSSSVEVMLPIGCDYRLWDAGAVATRDHSYGRSLQYQELKDGLTDAMIDRAVTVMPHVDGHVVHREAATPLTQERFTQSTDGASYGIEMNTRQFAVRRPGPSTSVQGLFLAGASCRPGPSTEGVMLSGVQAASTILGRDLLREFRQGKNLVPAGTLAANDLRTWDPLEYSRGRAAASRAGT